MRISLILIITIITFSCKKKEASTKVAFDGTETVMNQTQKEVSSQEVQSAIGDVFHDQISMEVDESVFVIDNGTNRANEDMSAGIMKMLAPQPYDVFKERMLATPEQQNGATSLLTEEMELGGRKTLVQKSMVVDDAGDEMIMMMHAFGAGKDKTIMISSYFMKNEEAKYLPLIEKSVATAKLRK